MPVLKKAFFFNISNLKPMVTWGTSPEDGIGINEVIPSPIMLKMRK